MGVPVSQPVPEGEEGDGGLKRIGGLKMAVVSMKALLETGVHFGHRTRKWNPHMKRFIFTERNGIHIIDLQQTQESLEQSYALIRDKVANGGEVLFVGTKRQAQETIQVEADRSGMPYVNLRWLGGTLTNWQTIRSRIDELKDLERRRDEGEFDLLTKKEALMLNRKIDKLEGRLGGIREMNGLPEILFVVDVNREETAVHEANLLEIPVVALVDTNCEPSEIDYVIPSNDDAIRAIKLLTSVIADAVMEGLAMRKDLEAEKVEATAEVPAEFEEMADEELLGEATLAKLESGEYGDQEEETEQADEEADDKADEADAEAEDAAAADDEAAEADEAEDEAGGEDESDSGDEEEGGEAEDDEDDEEEGDEAEDDEGEEE
jgi:small subunit ribosomal protein S2